MDDIRPGGAALPVSRAAAQFAEDLARLQEPTRAVILQAVRFQSLMPKFPTPVAFGAIADAKAATARLERMLGPIHKVLGQLSWPSAEFRRTLERVAEIAQLFEYPPNLRPLGLGTARLALDVAEQDGISLYLAPRSSIAGEFIRAESAEARRSILNRRFDRILSDCDDVLQRCVAENVAVVGGYLREAIAAAGAGHAAAAQTLATSVMEAVVAELPERAVVTSNSTQAHPAEKALKRDDVSFLLALVPVWRAYANYRPGDVVPRTFRRHATAHGAHPRQLTKRNTAQAILAATGVVAYAADL